MILAGRHDDYLEKVLKLFIKWNRFVQKHDLLWFHIVRFAIETKMRKMEKKKVDLLEKKNTITLAIIISSFVANCYYTFHFLVKFYLEPNQKFDHHICLCHVRTHALTMCHCVCRCRWIFTTVAKRTNRRYQFLVKLVAYWHEWMIP